uniref:Putative secreted protein 94 n=1 Tax=Amblyomma triste TaxID=251400 RepID=A0A023GDJ3_AMBTT
MLLLPLLIVGIGVCPTKSENVPEEKPPKNQTLIRSALKFLRSNQSIHLLMYSESIKGEIPECITSRLLSTSGGDGEVRRTLEADGNITSDFGKLMKPVKSNTTKPPQMKTISVRANVTVYVGNKYPSLQVVPDEDPLPPFWTDVQRIRHAARKCIILEAGSYNGDPSKPPCTLWGYQKEDKCEKKFENLCGNGVQVNLSDCERLEEKGDSQVGNQN